MRSLALLPFALTLACQGPGIPPAKQKPNTTIGNEVRAEIERDKAKAEAKAKPPVPAAALLPEEKHLSNLKQLTFGGENAEAYLSHDESQLSLQRKVGDHGCDQIYTMPLTGGRTKLLTGNKGRTTCAYFLPGDKEVLFASTLAAGDGCLPEPDRSHGYVWKLYPEHDIYKIAADGSGEPTPLITGPGYDAEATVSPVGDKIVFTSTRDGDPEIYVSDIEGKNIKRLTNKPGYDGGPFFSRDGKKIVYRANHPEGEEEMAKYQEIVKENLVRPTRLEIFVMNADGSEQTQVTSNGAANFAPFFHPGGEKIIFSSNVGDEKGRNFDIYLVDVSGENEERVTFGESFDGFPMFTADAKTLIFSSNRGGRKQGETNVFTASWVE